MSPTISRHRHSPSVAWQAAVATARRTKGGELTALTPIRFLGAIPVFLHSVLNPASVIFTHTAGISARVTDLSRAKQHLTLTALALTAVTFVLVFAKLSLFQILGVGLVAFVMVMAALGLAIDLGASPDIAGATHVIIDLVRWPDAPSGIAHELVAAISQTQPGLVVGISPDEKVWEAAYNQHATPVRTDQGRTEFTLNKEI